jgi:hypothetical protein
MRHRSILLLSVLRLALVPSLPAQAALALTSGPDRYQLEDGTGPGGGIASTYTISLISDWPQRSIGGDGCVNGGEEALSGTLVRTAVGRYAGQLERLATIRFCGSHGVARTACTLTLTSRGPVEAEGYVLPNGGEAIPPVLELRWAATEGTSAVTIDGDCGALFNESLRRLYLGVAHTIEFPLPLDGEAARTVRLDDYGWIVEVH